MTTRTYVVGENGVVRRRDDHTGPFIDVSIPAGPFGTMRCKDVMTDPNNPDKVIVVGELKGLGASNTGIMVSTDAGVNWLQAGGDYLIKNIGWFYEVWYVDSNVIWTVSDQGNVFRSLDGGLTFQSTVKPFNGVYNFIVAVHALSDQIGIVVGNNSLSMTAADTKVALTTDGGATWTTLNGDNPLTNALSLNPVGQGTGVWISSDLQKIIVGTSYCQIISTDGGATFTTLPPEITRSGIHLTWFPSYGVPTFFRNVGGPVYQVNQSSDSGSTWLNTRTGVFESMFGAHFYAANMGYYVIGNETFQTTDGAVTGTSVDVVPGIDLFEAVWTGVPVVHNCYLAVDCNNPQNTQVVIFENKLYEPNPDLIYVFDVNPDLCWHVQLTPCQDNNDDQQPDAIVVNPVATFVDCQSCLGTCYELRDCSTGALYTVNADLSQYIYKVIQVQVPAGDSFETRCFTVNPVMCPANPDVLQFTIVDCFDNCVDCSPVPPEPVPPLVIRDRSVKPGWSTKGCPPEYVEKVSCKFAEAIYQEAMSVRYGIQFCCETDAEKWTIKKELLDLKALYDPEACIPTNSPGLCCPPCNLTAVIEFPCEPARYLIASITIP